MTTAAAREGFWDGALDVRKSVRRAGVTDTFLRKLTLVERFSKHVLQTSDSTCHLCDDTNIGKYRVETHDGRYVFPAGMRHYLERHCVHPSREFAKYVVWYKPPTVKSFVLFASLWDDEPAMRELVRRAETFPRADVSYIQSTMIQAIKHTRYVRKCNDYVSSRRNCCVVS
jgi:hypothetical protein